MPHTDSARKALRKNLKRRERNRTLKKSLRLELKAFVAVMKGTGSQEDKSKALASAVKRIDKSSARGIIHKNAGNRKKSQVARMFNKAIAAPQVAPVAK